METQLVIKPIYGETKAIALRAAKEAFKKGRIFSLPDTIDKRIALPFTDQVWTNWSTPNTEEDVLRTSQGKEFIVEHIAA